ncbi:Flp family type IVb pilin [Planctomycetota bacterium]
MERIKALVQRFLREEDGLELVEYALMAAVVVVIIIVAIVYLWSRVRDRYVNTGDTVGSGAGMEYNNTAP